MGGYILQVEILHWLLLYSRYRDTAWAGLSFQVEIPHGLTLVFQVRIPHGLPSFWTDPVSHVEKLGWPYTPRRGIGLAQYFRKENWTFRIPQVERLGWPFNPGRKLGWPEPVGVEFGLAKKPVQLFM